MVRLLDATEAVIADEGWSAATTRRVADRAGVAQGLVHYHAGSIDNLRREATIRAIRRFFDQPMAAFAPTPAGVLAWVTELVSPGPGGASASRELRLLHESLPAAGRDEALRVEIATLLDVYRGRIASTLESAGVAPAAASALAATITASVDGAVLQRSLDPGFNVTPIAEVLAAAVLAEGPA